MVSRFGGGVTVDVTGASDALTSQQSESLNVDATNSMLDEVERAKRAQIGLPSDENDPEIVASRARARVHAEQEARRTFLVREDLMLRTVEKKQEESQAEKTADETADASIAMGMLASRMSRRGPPRHHRYGHHRDHENQHGQDAAITNTLQPTNYWEDRQRGVRAEDQSAGVAGMNNGALAQSWNTMLTQNRAPSLGADPSLSLGQQNVPAAERPAVQARPMGLGGQ